MRYFPMFLEMRGRDVLLAGGGEQIAQKARLLRRTEARLTIMAAELCEELSDFVTEGGAVRAAFDFEASAVARADFVFIGVEDEALAQQIAQAARAAGALVNVIDQPDACDMITPALVDRDPVVVAIGTEGAAPVLARHIKTDLEASLSPRLGAYIAHLQSLRPRIAEAVPMDGRRPFWRWAVSGAPWTLWDEGRRDEAREMLDASLEKGGAVGDAPVAVSVVEAPEVPDLASLRAVRRLQEAALIIHAQDADEGLLDLARRDAERAAFARCPRHDPAKAMAAIAAAEGPVVLIAPAGCGAGPDDFPGARAERISAAFAND
ncbi:MAG: NAD(P)-dependent oxidoreductase [Pseudomonadota bacterium]